MALWLVRAGKHGEYEDRYFNDNRIYLTWTGPLQELDLGKAADYEGVKKLVLDAYPAEPKNRLQNWAGQVWAFVLPMKPGDLVVLPRKTRAALAFGEITGGYSYDSQADPPFRHSRAVKWITTDVPRSTFDQDLLIRLVRS